MFLKYEQFGLKKDKHATIFSNQIHIVTKEITWKVNSYILKSSKSLFMNRKHLEPKFFNRAHHRAIMKGIFILFLHITIRSVFSMKFEMFKNNSHMKKSPSKFWNTRGKKIVEKLSRPRFFPGFEISRPFSPPV